jgi:WD40 repeat protein
MSRRDAEKRPGAGMKGLGGGKRLILVAVLSLQAGNLRSAQGDGRAAPSFERDIKPLLAKRCTVCHRASKRDDSEVSGGLALDSFEAAIDGTKRHKVIVPGQSGKSELWHRLADSDDERRMPLDEDPLPKEERELVRRWIDAGAPRGVEIAPSGGALVPASATAVKPRARRVRSVDVVLKSGVKLAPGTLNAKEGGELAVSLKIGPLPAVTALAFRGDRRILAVGTHGEAILWDLEEGAPVSVISNIAGPVHALAFSRDGRRLAIGAGLPARYGVLQVYSAPDGTKIHDFPGHTDVVTAIALRPDGAQLASASFDQTVRFWNLGQNRADGCFRGHSDFVYAIAYTPDSHSLLTAGKDRMIKRINPRTLKEERTYSDHGDEVLALAVHPFGKRFVTGGNEPQLRWWSYDGPKPVSRRGGHSGAVQQLAFSADGQRLISAGADGSVRIWHGKTGEQLRQLVGGGDWQYAIAISGDGHVAAAGGWDGLVRLWDAETGRLRATLVQYPSTNGMPMSKTESAVAAWFAVSPTGHVSGSPELIREAQWRAGGVILPSDAASKACRSARAIAQAMRGEPIQAVTFSGKARK